MRKKLWKRLLTGLVIFTLVTGLCACSLFKDDNKEADSEVEEESDEDDDLYVEFVPTFEGPTVLRV